MAVGGGGLTTLPVAAQPTNADNIEQAEVAIVSTCKSTLAAGGVVIAIGDFNGPLVYQSRRFDGLAVCRNCPAEPTQLGKAYAVDGAVVLSTQNTIIHMLECELAVPAQSGERTSTVPIG